MKYNWNTLKDIVFPISIGILTVCAIRILTHQGLALDGSFGALRLYDTQSIHLTSGREFEKILNQFLAWGLLHLYGQPTGQQLSYWINIAVFGLPSIIWIYSAILASRYPEIFNITFIAIAAQIIFSSNMALPSALANSVGLLLCILTAYQDELTKRERWLLYLLAIVSIRLYESMLIYSGLILLSAAWRLWRSEKLTLPPLFYILVFLVGVSSSVGFLFPNTISSAQASNISAAFSFDAMKFHAPMGTLAIFLALFLASLYARLLGLGAGNLAFEALILVVFMLVVVFLGGVQIGPTAHWYLKVPVTFFVAFCAFLVVFRDRLARRYPRASYFSVGYQVAAVLLMIIFSLSSAIGWVQYLSRIEHVVNDVPEGHESRVIPYADLRVPTALNTTYSGTWATPFLSVMLRYGPNMGLVQNEFPSLVTPENDAYNVQVSLPIYDGNFLFWSQR